MEPVKQNYQSVRRDTPVVMLEVGKMPPHAADLEEAVLGAMLIDKKGQSECFEVIRTADVFYRDAHKVIFEAARQLAEAGDPVDMITVSEQLKRNGKLEMAGGDWQLIQLTQKVSSSAHIEFHSRILLQYYIKRTAIMQMSKLIADAYNEETDSLELLDNLSGMLDIITSDVMQGKQVPTFKQNLENVYEKVRFLTDAEPGEVTGVSTGFNNVDRFTCGWQEEELIIIAARPGMGKTALMMKCVNTNAKKGVPVGVVSAEMSAYSLTARSIAGESSFHLRQLTKEGFEKPQYFGTLDTVIRKMENYPIYIDDKASPDISHVMNVARAWKRKHNIGILVVDYLQLLRDSSVKGNREAEIASISRKLKAIGKELKIPVVALSQLSRAVETRGGNKRPLLSDLRESGAIEQDADAVIFIYRPEYYGYDITDDGVIDEGVRNSGGDTELIFAKYRGGAPNTVLGLRWDGNKTKFYDPEEYAQWQQQNDSLANGNVSLPTPTAAQAFDAPLPSNNNDETPF